MRYMTKTKGQLTTDEHHRHERAPTTSPKKLAEPGRQRPPVRHVHRARWLIVVLFQILTDGLLLSRATSPTCVVQNSTS